MADDSFRRECERVPQRILKRLTKYEQRCVTASPIRAEFSTEFVKAGAGYRFRGPRGRGREIIECYFPRGIKYAGPVVRGRIS